MIYDIKYNFNGLYFLLTTKLKTYNSIYLMVVSVLNKEINYHENKGLNTEDSDLDASIYETEILSVPLQIVVGDQQFLYIEKNIVFIPIYLIHNGEFIEKIGIYEILADQVIGLLDEDGDIDITLLDEPLLFSYVDKVYLEKYAYKEHEGPVEEDDSDEEESEEDESDQETEKKALDEELVRDIPVVDVDEETEAEETTDKEEESGEEDSKPSPVLTNKELIVSLYEEDMGEELTKEETQKDHDVEQADFKPMRKNWLQQYMKNDNYTIIDNEGGGDCLFAVIRDAFASIGKKVSISQLRSILADNATQTQFETLKMLYDSFKAEYDTIDSQMKSLIKMNKEIKARVSKKATRGTESSEPPLSREEKRKLVKQSKENAKKYRELKPELAQASGFLEEYSYLIGVNTLDDFKKVIQTREYWGETWSISTLERVLNIKFIVLSSEAYKQRDYANVLQCGQLNDSILEERGVFKPKYYIMTDWLGWHYKTIAYKGKKIMTYEELPYGIKQLIFEKCMQRNSGPFSLIPRFVQGKAALQSESEEEIEELPEEGVEEKEGGMEEKKESEEDTSEKGEGKSIVESKPVMEEEPTTEGVEQVSLADLQITGTIKE